MAGHVTGRPSCRFDRLLPEEEQEDDADPEDVVCSVHQKGCVLEKPGTTKLAKAFGGRAPLLKGNGLDTVECQSLDVRFAKHHAEEREHTDAVAEEGERFEWHASAIEEVVGSCQVERDYWSSEFNGRSALPDFVLNFGLAIPSNGPETGLYFANLTAPVA